MRTTEAGGFRLAYTQRLQISTTDYLPGERRRSEIMRPSPQADTQMWINYFTTAWASEKLPRDWYNLRTQNTKRVGFIMSKQLDLLEDPGDMVAVSDWAQKTKRDLEGFKLEFLSDRTVYPRKYIMNPDDPTRLEDPLYGKSKDGKNYADIAEIVSDQERNGSVKASIQKTKEFLLTAPDGAIAVMTSPLGRTGFKTDDGLGIDYPDSYFFVMEKKGDEVMNYTLKTDFSLRDCNEAIFQLTGKKLPITAPLEQYVQTLALIDPSTNGRIQSVDDVVGILQGVQPTHAFLDKQNDQLTSWSDVTTAIHQGERLYRFDQQTAKAIDNFVEYATQGDLSKQDLQQGIAATILRLGDIFFQRKPTPQLEVTLTPGVWDKLTVSSRISFGAILEKTAERRGCSGGGSGSSTRTLFDSLTPRLGTVGEDQYGSLSFNCPSCSQENIRPRGQLIPSCQHCGSSAVSC